MKELTPEDYKIKQDYATDLYKSSLRLRQYQTAFKVLDNEAIVFEPKGFPSKIITLDDIRIARGMKKGAYYEVCHTLYEKDGVWIDELNEHDKEMGDLIIKQVDTIPEKELFKTW